jgi:hypothetical protein
VLGFTPTLGQVRVATLQNFKSLQIRIDLVRYKKENWPKTKVYKNEQRRHSGSFEWKKKQKQKKKNKNFPEKNNLML